MSLARVCSAWVGPALLGCVAVTAWAGDSGSGPLHRVSFQVERSRDVANDRVRAVVGTDDEDASSAALAERINVRMTRALATARKNDSVKVESGAYRTYPVHEDGRIRRWRASQDLVLEGSDASEVGELVAELQRELVLRSMDFSLSPALRREVEAELVVEVLAAFRERARLVEKSFGASDHELVQVDLDTQGGGGVVPMRAMRTRGMADSPTVPALEGGTRRVTVRAHGTIELD
ncbi:SIMPL domain-containing protein [Myxococcota bacterium]|nr:SIMPL domain-containing protein [Myxococcota bacterium]